LTSRAVLAVLKLKHFSGDGSASRVDANEPEHF
jgi:hypothetical protein